MAHLETLNQALLALEPRAHAPGFEKAASQLSKESRLDDMLRGRIPQPPEVQAQQPQRARHLRTCIMQTHNAQQQHHHHTAWSCNSSVSKLGVKPA
jgi:hypothetical protein